MTALAIPGARNRRPTRAAYGARMRAGVALCVAAAAAAVAGCGSSGTGESGSCAAVVVVDGVVYVGHGLPRARKVTLGEAAVRGIEPACNDAGQDEEDRTAELRAIAGVPVSAAVAAPGDDRTVYLAPGFLTDVAAHPLYAVLHDRARLRAQRRARRRCRAPARLTGVVQAPLAFASSTFAVAGTRIAVDGDTRYGGPLRDGVPHLGGGERIAVRGHRCPRGDTIVADRIDTA